MIRSGYEKLVPLIAHPTPILHRAVGDQLRTRNQDAASDPTISQILLKGVTSLPDKAELRSILKSLVSWRTHPISNNISSPLLVLFRECVRKQLGDEKMMAICEPIANYELHLLTDTQCVVDLPTVLTNVWIEHKFPSVKTRRRVYELRSSVDGIVYTLARHVIATSAILLASEELRRKHYPIIPKIGQSNQAKRTNITPKKRRVKKPKSLLLARVK